MILSIFINDNRSLLIENRRIDGVINYRESRSSKCRIESALRVAELAGDLIDWSAPDERTDPAIGGIDALVRAHDVHRRVTDHYSTSRRILDLLAHYPIGPAHPADRPREMVALQPVSDVTRQHL